MSTFKSSNGVAFSTPVIASGKSNGERKSKCCKAPMPSERREVKFGCQFVTAFRITGEDGS